MVTKKAFAAMDDLMNIEGEADNEETYYLSMQRLINSGEWSLPGRNGRAMHDAIEAGKCLLGHEGFRDYWGNRVPSRTEVKPGTKGSVEYVVEHSGIDWADMIKEV
jgi:hypothetical protein